MTRLNTNTSLIHIKILAKVVNGELVKWEGCNSKL